MRIISQDGCYDIPYEQAMLLRYGSGIYLMSQNFSGVERIVSDPVIAEYSTEEKAIKAMEMLRMKYGDYLQAKSDTFAAWFCAPKVFQFPADEDIEV